MSVGRRLAELQEEATRLGLEVIPAGTKLGKRDYVKALGAYYMDQYRQAGTLSAGAAWANQFDSPMLAVSPTSVKKENVEKSWDSTRVAFQEKADGCRLWVVYFPEEGFTFFSRNISVTDFLFSEYTNQIKGFEDKKFQGLFKEPFVLDCELISVNPSVNGRIKTETVLEAVVALLSLERTASHESQELAGFPLRFKVFDCLMVKGVNIMDKPLSQRDELAGKICEILQQKSKELNEPSLSWFEKLPLWTGTRSDKEAKFDEIIAAGGEGLILKGLDAPYESREARGNGDCTSKVKGCFLKAKKTVSERLGDDIDAFVTGYKLGTPGTANEGLVAALDFSVYLLPSGNIHHIASCSNLPLELKQRITVKDSQGQPTLDPAWFGKVAAIEGMDISSSLSREDGVANARLVHSRILRWREGADGKSKDDCTFPEALLNDLVL